MSSSKKGETPLERNEPKPIWGQMKRLVRRQREERPKHPAQANVKPEKSTV